MECNVEHRELYVKVMKELNDAQRINNVTVKIVGIETPFDIKKTRT